jgi:succinate dehydrogenase / fumarate reductase flavoprotein subunit
VPDVFEGQYAKTEAEGDRWYADQENNKRPPELLPRDEVARAINSEVKAGRGSPHGGVYLDVSSRLSPEVIKKKLPSMYSQFMELADVDITATPFEVGPTCHYVMGGVEVDADTEATAVPGLFACGEVSGGMHGANRLGGNSLSDLLVFGRRAGIGAVEYIGGLGDKRPTVSEADLEAAGNAALAPFHADAQTRAPESATPENPYTVHTELQQVMSDLVGIIRRESELSEALQKLVGLRKRAENAAVEGHRQFNPGWHLALDLRNMLDVSECIAKSALERHESRGGHTREDYPGMHADWRGVNLVCRITPGTNEIGLSHKPVPTIRPDLLALFDRHELEKYLTEPELAVLENPQTSTDAAGEQA